MNNGPVECITRWQEFEDLANQEYEFGRVPHPMKVFRGHSTIRGTLLPTLARGLELYSRAHVDAATTEAVIREEIMARSHGTMLAGINEKDWLGQSALLRHYGAPSRVLDWSNSPFVALYFACAHEPDANGELWSVSTYAVNEGGAGSTFRREVESAVAAWMFDREERNRIAFVQPRRHSARSAAQQCWFSVADDPRADHKDLIKKAIDNSTRAHSDPGWDSHGLRRVEIAKECKRDFLKRLLHRNVHAGSLFPDLEGLCRYAGDLLTLYPFDIENAVDKVPALDGRPRHVLS